jgi:integrase
LPRFAGNGFVFPSATGHGPVVSSNYAKKHVMEHMGVHDWRLHDLRRTCCTGLVKLGVQPHIAQKILNHRKGAISGVDGMYDRWGYLDERRDALNAWGQFIERLVGANVVERRPAAAP